MSKCFFPYDYCKPSAASVACQYGDLDLTEYGGVEARYVKRIGDEGNPFIEALPRPRSREEFNLVGSKGISGYVYENEKKKKPEDQLRGIARLRSVRFPLPMNYELEDAVYIALVNSYRARQMLKDKGGDISLPYEAGNTSHYSDGILVGNDAAAANAGMTLLGYSGCGKSSALETVFANYPQYIIHRGEGLTTYPQIVYLVVQCPPHSNFKGLFKNIGVAIDRALGNVKPVYAKELDAGNSGNLARYTDKVRELIEKFAIGMIVFDEIQHLNFDSTLENSFESILELTNQTKVAFGVVGTEDAYDKIFAGNLRQARRLGAEIHADKYCGNKKLFHYIVNRLFKYQWFDTLVEPTQEIVDALYACTHGIIDQLIGLYSYMNFDYLNAQGKPVVDAEFVWKTANRHYPGMLKLLDKVTTAEAEQARAELMKKANDELNQILEAARRKDAEAASAEALTDISLHQAIEIKQEVVERIRGVDTTYSESVIEKACDQVMLSPEGKALAATGSTTNLTQLVFKHLKTQKKPSGSKAKKKPDAPSPTAIRSFLEESTVAG